MLPAMSGALYFVAFPFFDLWPLAWVFAVPLMWAVEGEGPSRAFLSGFVAGLVAWAGVLYWIALVMHTYGGVSLLGSVMLLVLLLAYLALYFGVFAAACARWAGSSLALFILPGAWAALEMFRSYLVFGGFPWALLGCSQLPFLTFAQVAELGGVFLVGAVVMTGNVAMYKALKGRFREVWPAVVLVCACCVFGAVRLHQAPFGGQALKVGVVQANVPQDQKWRPERTDEVLSKYLTMSRLALGKGAELVVWPETACTFYLFRQWPQTMRVLEMSRGSSARFIVGSPAYDEGRFYNRAYLLRKGRIEGCYDKVHLVPFGEYLPLSRQFRRIFGALTAEVGDFREGMDIEPMGDIGVLICFESVFPGLSRTLVNKGARLIVNISNDAWFKTWSTPWQHLQQACFRAIETRRYLVRSVNHGISAVVDPYGRIVGGIGLLKEGEIVHEVSLIDYRSLYARIGPLIPLLWAVLSLAFALTALTRSSRGGKAKGP
jgi:apolipoprotein N-acyltransferase